MNLLLVKEISKNTRGIFITTFLKANESDKLIFKRGTWGWNK